MLLRTNNVAVLTVKLDAFSPGMEGSLCAVKPKFIEVTSTETVDCLPCSAPLKEG